MEKSDSFNVVSVAEFVKDTRKKNALRKYDSIRAISLELCYDCVPYYKELSLQAKNAIYDAIRSRLENGLIWEK